MDWYTRRKLVYAFGVFIFICATSVYVFKDRLFPAPTCYDNKLNNFELEVDCGGTCALKCSSEVAPLTVLWSRALKVSSSTYDLVAMISNKNIDNASPQLGYTFIMQDADGKTIAELKGVTLAPINGDFPIIEQSITLEKEPHTVNVILQDSPHYGVLEKPTSPTIRISNEKYEAGDTGRVFATVTNAKRKAVSNLPLSVVVFDDYGNAFAVGKTIVPFLNKEESKVISFTWNPPLSVIPTRIKVYPFFDPFNVAN